MLLPCHVNPENCFKSEHSRHSGRGCYGKEAASRLLASPGAHRYNRYKAKEPLNPRAHEKNQEPNETFLGLV